MSYPGNPASAQILFGNTYYGGVSNAQGVVYFEIGGSETYVMGGHTVPDGNLSRDFGCDPSSEANSY